jgi:hypothetical protein
MVVQAPSKLLQEPHDGATLASEHSDQSSSKLSSSLGDVCERSIGLQSLLIGQRDRLKGYYSRDSGSSTELKSAVLGVLGRLF